MKGNDGNMKWGMHLWAGRIVMGAALAAMALCLSACGAEGPRNEKAVSKSVGEKGKSKDDGAGKKDRRREEFFRKFRIADDMVYGSCVVTKNCIYEEPDDSMYDEGEEIVQKTRQGKELSRHKLEILDSEDLVEGSEKRLLIATDEVEVKNDEESNGFYIYQVPIRQTGTKETPLWEKKERVAEFDGESENIYLHEPYLIYCDGNKVVRMDLESGEKKTLEIEKNVYDLDSLAVMSEEGNLFLNAVNYDNHALDGIYRIDLEGWQAEKIYSDQDTADTYYLTSVEDGMLYLLYLDSNIGDSRKLVCYDSRKKEAYSLAAAEIEKFLDQEQLYGGKEYENHRELKIAGIYPYADRVYVDCHLLLGDAEDGEGSGGGGTDKAVPLSEPDNQIQRLVSFPKGEPSRLRYEKEMMDSWHDHVAGLQGDDGEKVMYSDGIFAAFENELYFSCKGEKKGRAHISVYDLESGEMRELGEGELAYQVLSPLSGYVYGYD